MILVGGWLLGFVLAILQRIIPFLAAMHSSADGRPPALPSRLAPAWASAVHFVSHLAAIALLCLGLLFGLWWAVGLGLAAGLSGALAFAVHAAFVPWRLRRHRAATTAPTRA
jgi:hypothetical protein